MKPINLNGEWAFLPASPQETQTYFDSKMDTSAWDTIPVPSDWRKLGYAHEIIGWYRREFYMPINEDCSVWWLECQGVHAYCQIWINGQYVGEHRGSFTRFRFDVTDFVQLDNNIIAVMVRADTEGKAFRDGIWGQIQLTPYDCEKPPQTEDWYQPSTTPLLRLNKKGNWLRGDAPFFPRIIEYFPPAINSPERMKLDIRLIKEANFNTIYLNNIVLPDHFYRACTNDGVFVWQDISGWQDVTQAREMILQLRHHECLIAWSVDKAIISELQPLDTERPMKISLEDENYRIVDLQDGIHHTKHGLEFARWDKQDSVSGVLFKSFEAIIQTDSGPLEDYNVVKVAMQPLSPLAHLPLAWYKGLPIDSELHFEVAIVNDLPQRFRLWQCRISLTSWIPSEDSGDETTYLYHWRHTTSTFTVEPCSKLELGEIVVPPAKRRKAQYRLVLQLYDTTDDHAPMMVNVYLLQPA